MKYKINKIKIEKWKTSDGFLFDTYEEAEKHQIELFSINDYCIFYGVQGTGCTDNK